MVDVFGLQQDFLNYSGLADIPDTYTLEERIDMSENLVREEINEWLLEERYTPKDLKEATDMMYVLAQYLNVTYGTKIAQEAFRRVHTNNMSKISGDIVRRDDGKVQKNVGYKKVSLADLLDG